jgi:hypothetical protein
LQLFGQRRALWMEGFCYPHRGHSHMPMTVSGNTASGSAMAAFAGGQWWVSYYSADKGIVLHPFNSLVGYGILPKGDGWHNIRAISDDRHLRGSRTHGSRRRRRHLGLPHQREHQHR